LVNKKKEEGRRKKEEGRRKKEEGRNRCLKSLLFRHLFLPFNINSGCTGMI